MEDSWSLLLLTFLDSSNLFHHDVVANDIVKVVNSLPSNHEAVLLRAGFLAS